MRKANYILAASIILAQAACTTLPDRFNTKDLIVENCGYVIDNDNQAGFTLEIALREYTFFPNPDPAITSARQCFRKIAAELSQRKGRSASPIGIADMSTTSNRNTVDGYYLINVVGKVVYAPK